MATVTAYTAARSLQIENSSVTSGAVDANGNLILTTRGGTPINAGYVVGPAGTPVGSIEQTVKNSSGVAIAKGNVVYISGALDGTALIAKAQANSDATSSKVLGLASEAINNGQTGKVMTEGVLTGFDTSAATDGDTVWLSATVPGGFVYGDANRPLAPNHSVYVGKVLEAHPTLGSIYIRIDNGDQINELHDVKVSSPASTHVLARNSGNTLWQNRALEAADIPNLQNLNGTLDIASGGTGASTALAALKNLGAGAVKIDPTSIGNTYGTASVSAGEISYTNVFQIVVNGVFSSNFRNYAIFVNNSGAFYDKNIAFRMVKSGTVQTSGYYSNGLKVYENNAPTSYGYVSNGTEMQLCETWMAYDGGNFNGHINVYDPTAQDQTTFTSMFRAGNRIFYSGGQRFSNGSDGFAIVTSGTDLITGKINVYGWN